MSESKKRYGAKRSYFRGYSHAQLTLLGLYASVDQWEWRGTTYDGTSAYEIEKRWREGVGGIGGYARSSIYAWSKKLAEDGLLSAQAVSVAEGEREAREWLREVYGSDGEDEAPGGEEETEQSDPAVGGRTTIYTVTPAGAKLLNEWLESPCTVPASEDEAAVRVMIGRDAPEELRFGLATMRPELTTLLRRLEETAARRGAGPLDQLDLDLYRSLADARLKWLDRVERALARELREQARRRKEMEKGTLAQRQQDEDTVRRYRKR